MQVTRVIKDLAVKGHTCGKELLIYEAPIPPDRPGVVWLILGRLIALLAEQALDATALHTRGRGREACEVSSGEAGAGNKWVVAVATSAAAVHKRKAVHYTCWRACWWALGTAVLCQP